MKEKGDFKFLIGKTLEQARQETPGYKIFVGEEDGQTFYRSIDFNPNRVNVSIRRGFIFRIDDVC